MTSSLTEQPKTLGDILEDIGTDRVDDLLGSVYPQISLTNFSKDKNLYKFQQDALENAVKALYLFYYSCQDNANKEEMFNRYLGNQIALDDVKQNVYLREYAEYFPINTKNKKISFKHFCNRMSFWMATGSGKTLIIIKLIEILHGLMMAKGPMPERDILFLCHKNDLIEQFKVLVREFNEFSKVKINLVHLKEFDTAKKYNRNILKDEITVFYYSSDLISDTRKENIVDFRDYDNNGNWFILLDEAHRGVNEVSKRQAYYSILSRNGFLFNFSATFTESNDNSTCAFNFNLERFINAGYGKQVYVSDQDIKGFDKKADDFKEIYKQKIVLKTLILHTYICGEINKIKEQSGLAYHKPLLMALVNRVNMDSKSLSKDGKSQEPDLKLLFTELQKIANNEIKKGLFEAAKDELKQELSNGIYFFDDKRVPINIKELAKVSYKKVLHEVFNAETHGKIEFIRNPNNKQELIFKLKTGKGYKPFALIRIGEISAWLKNLIAEGVSEATNPYTASAFSKINNADSSINILMGSRTFYEGWDSNRPNIILFINIGTTPDARKFVMQAIGRGVRIEPLKNKKQRLLNIKDSGDVETLMKVTDSIYGKVEPNIHAPETLFIFGTNADNINKIISYMKGGDAEGTSYQELGDIFKPLKEKDVTKKDLLIPTFTRSGNLIIDSQEPAKYSISEEDLKLTEELLSRLSDKLVIMKYGSYYESITPGLVAATRKTFKDQQSKDKYYKIEDKKEILGNPVITLDRIIKYFGSQDKELNQFESLRDQIRHHTEISFKGDANTLKELKDKIKIMSDYPAKKEEVDKAWADRVPQEEYNVLHNQLSTANTINIKGTEIDIKYIGEHYYNPILVSKEEKQNYLKHIIQVKSEVDFVKKVEELGKKDWDDNFDWWIFSKLDATVDTVNIPYYNALRKQLSNYNPDFIFWFKKDDNYSIVFIDPKGTSHTDYQQKADWHGKFFGSPGSETAFAEDDTKIKVYLRFFTDDANTISKGYRDYWIDNVQDIAKIAKG